MYRVKKLLEIDELQKYGLSGKNVGIAVIDTGISKHDDFNFDNIYFHDYVNGYINCYDDNGHGSHVCGIICGSGKKSKGRYCGIAPDSKIIMLKCLDKSGNGKIVNAIKACEFIFDNHTKLNIRIVNISVGAVNDNDLNIENLKKVVYKLWEAGIVVVAAAGNNGPNPDSITIPGACREIITVGASDDNVNYPGELRRNYSGRGKYYDYVTKPEIVAPGTGIISCDNKNGYKKKSGTSMAAPIVSGTIALLLEYYPELNNHEIRDILYRTAKNIGLEKTHQGYGQIYPYRAFSEIKSLKKALK